MVKTWQLDAKDTPAAKLATSSLLTLAKASKGVAQVSHAELAMDFLYPPSISGGFKIGFMMADHGWSWLIDV